MFRLSRGAAFLVLGLGMLLGPQLATAGTKVVCRFVGPGDSLQAAPGLFLFLQGQKARLDIQVPPWKASVLYDRSTRVLTVLDHVFHTYDEYGSAKRMVLRNSLGLALRVNDLRLKNGPEIDKRLRDHLAEAVRMAFNVKFQKTPKAGKFSKWATERYEARNGKVLLETSTVVQPSAIPDSEQWATWKEFLQVLLETGKGGLVYFGAEESSLEGWPGFQGFPVLMTWKEGAKTPYRFSVVILEQKVLRPDMFSPPDDYKPQNILDYLKQ